jgi:hypothetical protein
MPANTVGSDGSAKDTPSTTTVRIMSASLTSQPSANETTMLSYFYDTPIFMSKFTICSSRLFNGKPLIPPLILPVFLKIFHPLQPTRL